MKKLIAEYLGTALLLMAIVGSGRMASSLTEDIALQLLLNAISASLMLLVIINLFSSVSGAHFNPVVSLFQIITKDLELITGLKYILAQFLGAISGTIMANAMFESALVSISTYERFRSGTFIGELVATFGLILVVALKSDRAGVLVPAWIGSAYFFTSSTAFANPAVTLGRIFTESFAGIAPISVIGFIGAQLLALVIAYLFLPALTDKSESDE